MNEHIRTAGGRTAISYRFPVVVGSRQAAALRATGRVGFGRSCLGSRPEFDAYDRDASGRRYGCFSIWVAEQLDLIKLMDQSCGLKAPRGGPTVGEMVLAVAVQRACAPAGKCHLAAFLESCVPRVSCLPAAKFTGQAFHRLASQVTDEQL